MMDAIPPPEINIINVINYVTLIPSKKIHLLRFVLTSFNKIALECPNVKNCPESSFLYRSIVVTFGITYD